MALFHTLCYASMACLLAAPALAHPSAPADSADSADARMAAWLAHPQRIARAARTPTPPVIDGVLDDAAWEGAPVQSDFLQYEPTQGMPATQRTTFLIVYDDEALYLGMMCHDSAPDSIVARLGRRDSWAERDYVQLNLDPLHDHQTGFYFRVGPSGWREDGILFSDTGADNTWDGVWDTRVARVPGGWSVELEIPYRNLRFGDAASQTWGLNVARRISRYQEFDQWTLIPRGFSGWTSRYGHLEGIEGIEPRRSLEVLPLVLGRVSRSAGEGNDLAGTAGVDVRYGLTSNVSLNATVNPDFGQVEADPAVLNLSVFETFYSERRPFFVEGSSIFTTPSPDIVGIGGPARLFHSRRIGAAPGRLALPDSSEELSRPDNTTILGALKISGKTSGRTAFGVLDAVTDAEEARAAEWTTDPVTGRQDTTRHRVSLEPRTNWFVGRLQQDLLTNSTVGAQVTAVNGDGSDPAYVGAVDGNLKWRNNEWRLYGRAAASRAGQGDERGSGWEGVAYLSKFSGRIGGQLYADARSPGFDVDELGYMNRNDRAQTGAHAYYEILQPYWFARRSGFNLNVWRQWNFDGDALSRGVNFNTWHELHSYWGFQVGISRDFRALDDLDTRGGPPIVRPADLSGWLNIWADERQRVSGSVNANGSYGHGGDNRHLRVGGELSLRLTSYLDLELEPGFGADHTYAQWVDNADADGDGQDDTCIYGELDSRVLDVGVRGTWSFTPLLSLQVYLQPFVATGDYGRIKSLARPRSYSFTPYDGLDGNPDFSRRSLRSNWVLRWEYRPGSTLFVVWQQNRSHEADDPTGPAFRPAPGLARAFADDGDNILLVKVNRWVGL